MVSQLITKMVGDGDDPSSEEAETIIKNVATVTVEGMLAWHTSSIAHRLYWSSHS